MDKPLVIVIRNKSEKTQIININDKSGDITIYPPNMIRTVRPYCEQL